MSYYGAPQWPADGQATWEHQTPQSRSGASSAIPREEPTAFWWQFEEVDRAVDNLVKSGKMFGGMGLRHNRMGGSGPRNHGVDYEGRGHPSNLQNFYASQRHQTSRGSNDAEQMMQAKRRMAAQRERELRNYHQEQQYNRTVLSDLTYSAGKPDRALSPGSMSEDDRRELIARQRSALYGEGSFTEGVGYVDETGNPRQGISANGPPSAAALRGHSPLAYDYARGTQPLLPPGEPGPQSAGGASDPNAGNVPNQRSRANSTSSPQSSAPMGGPPGSVGGPQQSSRTSNSSPGGSPPRGPGGVNNNNNGGGKPSGGPPGPNTVAPIGTRPSMTSGTPPANPALNKRSTTPLASPLGQGVAYGKAPGAPNSAGTASGPGDNDNTTPSTAGPGSNPNSASAEMGGGWGSAAARSAGGVWGSNTKASGLGAVWG